MDQRLTDLERLARLRADGAISDAEYQGEKARILGPAAPASPSFIEDASPAPRSRRGWWLAGLGLIGVAGAALVLTPRPQMASGGTTAVTASERDKWVKGLSPSTGGTLPAAPAVAPKPVEARPPIAPPEEEVEATPLLRGEWALNDGDTTGGCRRGGSYVFAEDGSYSIDDERAGRYVVSGSRLTLSPRYAHDEDGERRAATATDRIVMRLDPISGDTIDAVDDDGTRLRLERCS